MTGLAIACYGLFYWYSLSFGPVEGDTLIRIVCAASVLISIGFQLIFAAFFMVLLDQQPGMDARPRPRIRRKSGCGGDLADGSTNQESSRRPINRILLGQPNSETADTLNTNPLNGRQWRGSRVTERRLRLLSSAKKP